MHQTADSIFSFGEFEVDSAKRLLLKRGQSVHLKSKAFDLLLTLLDHRGEILSKNDLLDLVWENQFVEENNLTVHVAALRKALGETKDEHRFIVTVPGRGYKFVGQLNGNNGHDPKVAAESELVPAHAKVEEVKSSFMYYLTANRRVAISIVAVVLLIAVGGSFYVRNSRRNAIISAASSFQNFTIKRLTTDGKALGAALSPDGKLFVYSHFDGENQSLLLGHVDGGESIQLRPPEFLKYFSLKFSPDGSSIYYGSGDENGSSALYRIPVFGGAPEKIEDKAYNIAFAPDGKRFAFIRQDLTTNKSVLVVSDPAGKYETNLATSSEIIIFAPPSVAWSPDGRTIALAASRNDTETQYDIYTVNVADGGVKPLTAQGWSWVGSASWLADGSLVANAQKEDSTHKQLWSVAYPDGEVRQLISDLNLYGWITSATNKNLLLTVQMQAQSNIWVAPFDDLSGAKQVTVGSIGRMDGWFGVEWTSGGRIAYTAEINGNNTIWIMNADGSDQKQLIPSEGNNLYPSLTADNSHIVFQSNRGGKYAVWSANLDGSDMRQLSDSGVAAQPHVSPDGRWIVYVSNLENSGELWRIAAFGGEAAKLADKASWPRISPDSRFIACGYESGGTKIAILSIDGGEPIKLFDVPRLANLRLGVRWTPDGKAVTYRDWVNGIWRQNLNGGEPQRLKGLPNEKLYAYDWSSDGKRFAFTRGAEIRDLVLINNSN